MPGAVPATSTRALTNATLPYALQLAEKSWQRATDDDPALAAGVNVHAGRITNPHVAHAFGVEVTELGRAA